MSVVNAFTRYAQRFLKSNLFQILHLNCYAPGHIYFAGEATSPVRCLYSMSILSDENHASNRFAMILSKLALLDFSRTTTFQFYTKGPLEPSFGPFFSRLPSADTMLIDSTSLRHLMVFQDDIKTTERPIVLFPFLKVLGFSLEHRSDDGVEVAVKFIQSRLQHGHPISVVDILSKLPLRSPRDLEVFAEAKGLKVTYTCLP